MKKLVFGILIFLLVYIVWILFIQSTRFSQNKVDVVYDKSKMNLEQLADTLVAKGVILEPTSFLALSKIVGLDQKLKSGKFFIKRKTALFSILRMFRNNQQASVKFILNKVRTRGELAKLVATTFETDSSSCAQFFNSNDSLIAYDIDTAGLLSIMIPDTYEFYWSTPLPKFLEKMKTTSDKFWLSHQRRDKANAKGLSPYQVYTLASIVEEETNYDSDKSLIASVYLNRLQKSMPLQACPTIKFAMQNFTLTRIYEKYLSNPSLYNTYNHKGLPPGPICTPSPKTIDIVLNAPKTNYLYFVAKSDFSGYHHFSSTFEEHNQFAKAYQKQLDIYQQTHAHH